MLEPLIVLTVLNCFFMFSSTVTTCALWWQYRSHRCCFKKNTQSTKHNSTKSKSNSVLKKSGNSRHEHSGHSVERSKSNSIVNRDNKSRRSSNKKSRSNAKYLVQNRALSDERLSSIEMMGNWELEDRTKMSEASQTPNDAKSAVVMEYSTVQKIVQILDNDTDLAGTKLVIKDLNAKQNVDEKKELMIEPQLEPLLVPEYTLMAQGQN
ncbi:hypothetical protein WH47_04968 [Habropoda laboriosa]|uniref:Uncharacterized protein n=1 Tax=Habropoda laboriosa TaxID=597456 RepID=A0A0L7RJ40_9HYME|nr:PREDICTED: uncharacterized protein LOC108580072 [Habropoda laboriosa]KOC70982.1 hypothetical protein WH47_04968 [Habropoda laboriosa]